MSVIEQFVFFARAKVSIGDRLMSLPEEPKTMAFEPAIADSASASRNAFDHLLGVGPTTKVGPKVLLVDDDRDDMFLSRKALESNKCEVVSATTVTEAFAQIAAQSFDVLITDLHMPDAGDGFAVVTAMRHTQPEALILVVSGFPDVQKAMSAIALQADEVLVKPFAVEQLARLINNKMLTSKPSVRPAKEDVAPILDRDMTITMERWLSRVEQVKELTALPLSPKERTAYLPEMIGNITTRLRLTRAIEAIDTVCAAAVAHGQIRHRQGYTAPMIVQESRILQVCIFETIERNMATVTFPTLMADVMIVADEVDSQLKQTIESFLTAHREKASGAAV
jgi:DNA-binding response OmpR family regulator